MQGVLLATSLCLSSLICAVMTFQTAGEARGLIFGLGFFLFVALFTHVFMQMRKKLPQLPAISKKPLYTAMVRVAAGTRGASNPHSLLAGHVLWNVATLPNSVDIWPGWYGSHSTRNIQPLTCWLGCCVQKHFCCGTSVLSAVHGRHRYFLPLHFTQPRVQSSRPSKHQRKT